jgi:hypothetical protein
MKKRIEELRKLDQANQLAIEVVRSVSGGQLGSHRGTYLTSCFAPLDALPITATFRKMSNSVACRLAELGLREPISLEQVRDCWWQVQIDAAELCMSMEYGCGYVTRFISTSRLAEIGFEVIDGPFKPWETDDITRAIFLEHGRKYWDAIVSYRRLANDFESLEHIPGDGQAYTSEELLDALGSGSDVAVHNGPFDTPEEASDALNLRMKLNRPTF